MTHTLAFDIGGTKLAAGIFDDTYALIEQEVWPTPQSYPDFIKSCADLARHLGKDSALYPTIGVSIAGWLTQSSGIVSAPNIPYLQGHSLRDDLSQELRCEVRLANDANCAALAEATLGAGKGHDCVVGLIIGTGVGAGVVIHGKITNGANGLAGEIGHLPLPFRTPEDGTPIRCGCGQEGCIEQSINGAALTRLCAAVTGETLSPPQIVAALQAGDSRMQAVLDHYYDVVAKAMVIVLHSFDPDVIVVSGGLSNLPSLYDGVTDRWGRYCYNPQPVTQFVPAQHGAMAGLLGAALLAHQ